MKKGVQTRKRLILRERDVGVGVQAEQLGRVVDGQTADVGEVFVVRYIGVNLVVNAAGIELVFGCQHLRRTEAE